MPGAFFGIETARRGMRVHQAGLDIIGHNVANASTPGYTRQAAVIQATNPHWVPSMDSYATPGQFGTGAEVSEIRRIKDEYLDNNVRQSTTSLHYWQDQISFLNRAESLFAEPVSKGISQCITDFFKAWMDLNNTPNDAGTKAAVVQTGERLANLLNSAYQQLDDVSNSVAKIGLVKKEDGTEVLEVTGGKLLDDVNRINDILTQVWETTGAIERVYGVNQQPNDLLDKRDMLLEELSQYGPVTVQYKFDNGKPTGRLESLTFRGVELALTDPNERYSADNAPRAGLNLAKDDPADPDVKVPYEIVLQINGADVINLTEERNNTTIAGSLLGQERARQAIETYKAELNHFAETMKAKLNFTINIIDPDNPSNTTPIELDFFTGSLAGENFGLNGDQMKEDIGNFAAKVAELRYTPIKELGDSTFGGYFAQLLTKVGGNTKQAVDMATTQSAITNQIAGLRDSVSGVAINEEMTQMIQFQYGFQASARMINTLDAMLDVVINRLF